MEEDSETNVKSTAVMNGRIALTTGTIKITTEEEADLHKEATDKNIVTTVVTVEAETVQVLVQDQKAGMSITDIAGEAIHTAVTKPG